MGVHPACFFLFITTIAASTSNPERLVLKLIHRDSGQSPLREPRNNATSSFSATRGTELFPAEGIPFDFVRQRTTGFTFLLNFSFGQPPVPQLTIMDTGSSLLWVHCHPCETCYHQSRTLMLDPSHSSTYASISCRSPYCSFAPHHGCNRYNSNCTYVINYIGNFASSGTFSTEQLTFETSDGYYVALSEVVFGCCHNVGNWSFGTGITGIFGLGPNFPSIVPRMNNKFSYCIGSLRDPDYGYNKLILGDGAIMEGDWTPLYFINNHYCIDLEAISVAEERLDIDPDTFKILSDGDGTVIDSGTQVTYLAPSGYKALRKRLKNFLDEFLEQTRIWEEDELCYKGSMNDDLDGFPVVTFHFAGGAELTLDYESMFYQRSFDEFCLAVFSSTRHETYPNLSIIGLLAQQYYNVAYDVGIKRLYFQRIDCELLEG